MKKVALICLGFFLVAGCATVPFRETPRVSMESADPRSVLEHFQVHLPESFQVLNSVVFEYNWQSFLGIGYMDVNRRDGLFKVVCLNPMGVKLFELSGDPKTIETHYVMEAFLQYGDLPKAVGSDIRRIYFDVVPGAGAQVVRGNIPSRFDSPPAAGAWSMFSQAPTRTS